MDDKQYWDDIHTSQQLHEVSWTQRETGLSLQFIRQVASSPAARILDVGSGDAGLVNALLAHTYCVFQRQN